MRDTQPLSSYKVTEQHVNLAQYLTFNNHISSICKVTRSIGIIQNLLTFDTTAYRRHVLIITRLYFCNSIS